jgi:hypothetical protein
METKLNSKVSIEIIDGEKTTRDYFAFTFYESNRDLSRTKANLDLIIKSMSKYGYLPGKPIMVSTDFKIIDGQHRFVAAKRLGLPIRFVVVDLFSTEAEELIPILNAAQRDWLTADYVWHYAKKRVPCYMYLQDFKERHHIEMAATVRICINKYAPGKIVRQGIEFKPYGKAENIANFLTNARQHIDHWNRSYFINAVIMMYHRIDNERLINKLADNIIRVTPQASPNDYLAVFENIINKGVKQINRVSLLKKT